MSIGRLIIVIALVSIVAVIFVLGAMVSLSKAKRMSEDQKFQKYNKRFRFYYDFVLSRSMFRKVYEQLGSLAVYTMLECRMQTVKFFERSLLMAVLLFVIGFIGLGDLVSGILLLMFAFVMMTTSISNRIDDVNFTTLKDISRMLQSIRECYTRVRNVPDAINDANCTALLSRQKSEIYLICTANNSQERLNEFYRTCPNRIMRTLATTCYIRADVGEDSSSGYSPFKKAIGLIKDEVDSEVNRQVNQRLMFGALARLPFIPLFLYPPMQMFYTKIISATASVFDSTVGFVIKLIVVLSCFISYYILSTINNSSVARTDDRMLSLTKLMYKDRVQRFAKTLIPKNNKKRTIVRRKLVGCLSSKTIDYFYLEKLVYAVSIMIVGIVFSVIILFSSRNAVYNGLSAQTMSAELTYTKEQEIWTRAFDAEVLKEDTPPTDDYLMEQFGTMFPKYTKIELEAQRDRLKAKYENYHKLKFKWWYVFIYIGCWFIGWKIPEMLLRMRTKLVQSEAEMDVLQLQTIVAILMDTNLDTLSVLYWLSKSSDIHKDILTYCYHEYVRDPQQALNNLKMKSANVEFTAMVDKLLTTVYQVTLAEAFEDLIGERENMMKIREAVQMHELKSKRNMASPIAMAPMMVWMVCVFILPVGIVAIRSAVSMLGNLQI